MSKALHEIVRDHVSLDQLMVESGGELTDDQQELIVSEWMQEIASDIVKKIDGYKYKMDSLESASESLRNKAKLISNAAKVLENMQENLKSKMKNAMQELNVEEISGNEFKFKLSNSKPTVVILNQHIIPAKFTREKITIEVDKEAVKNEIESGNLVEGCELKQNQVLRVTVNKNMKGIE